MTEAATRIFHLRWTLALGAAELLGIGATVVIAVSMLAWIGEPVTLAERLATYVAVLLGGASEGLALGTAQWWFLRQRLPGLTARAWVGVTTGLAVLGWAVGMFGPTFLADPSVPHDEIAEPSTGVVLAAAAAIGAGAGLLFGGAQWLVLRRHVERAGRWVVVNALGWTPAMALIFLGATVSEEDTPFLQVVAAGGLGALLGGLSLGAITGLVARGLTPRRATPSP